MHILVEMTKEGRKEERKRKECVSFNDSNEAEQLSLEFGASKKRRKKERRLNKTIEGGWGTHTIPCV
jgi:hypothetical protein